MTNNKSLVYHYRNCKPVIKLLVNAPSKGKRELEKVEYERIADYSEKLGARLLNKVALNPIDNNKIIKHKWQPLMLSQKNK